jgi:hypothetical protein
MADVDQVEVVAAHDERATLRVGDVFLKIDADQTRTDVVRFPVVFSRVPRRGCCGAFTHGRVRRVTRACEILDVTRILTKAGA